MSDCLAARSFVFYILPVGSRSRLRSYMVASLNSGRNCISLGSAALKLYAQRQVMARLIEENQADDENEDN